MTSGGFICEHQKKHLSNVRACRNFNRLQTCRSKPTHEFFRRGVCFNQDVKALVPKSKVFPKFLTFLVDGMADWSPPLETLLGYLTQRC